jgi:hypothetical protein
MANYMIEGIYIYSPEITTGLLDIESLGGGRRRTTLRTI